MEKILFEKRDIQGKKNKILIAEGSIPAVVYNAKGDSRSIKISITSASKIVREATSATILDAELDGKSLKVIVKEIDVNPLTEQIRHIAFFEIDESKEMTFTIPFNIVGISPAVKNNLGVLVEVLPSIEVKCKLASLIPMIDVDISGLDHPGQSISVENVNIPEGISLLNKDSINATIVTITEMQEEEVIVPEVDETVATETAEGGEAPVEGEETPEESKE